MDGGTAKRSAAMVAGGLFVGCAGIALYPHLGALGLVLALAPATVLGLRSKRSNIAELDSALDMIKVHDDALYWHGYRTAAYAGAIAREMGFRSGDVRKIHTAALLHDIGKIAIDKSLLTRQAPLTSDEFDQVKKHSQIGETILAQWDSTKRLAPWIRHHHERIDGSGYPDGITKDEIPIESRIIAVADAYDAMVGAAAAADSHPYRTKRERSDALEELRRCCGTQFDREVALAFESAMEVVEPTTYREC